MTGVYRGIYRREGLGFEGLRSPTGGEIDPPMWGTVLILVHYPTTLVFNVSGNFPPIKSFMAANIEPPQRGGVVNLYGAWGRESLWRRLYSYVIHSLAIYSNVICP